MSKTLVTGAGGFLGSAISRALLARGEEVVALDCAAAASRLNLLAETPGCISVLCDITDGDAVDAVFAQHHPTAVIHCASIVGVLASLSAPIHLMRVNVEGSINLFESMARHNCARVIHLSSEEIYGSFLAERIDENHREAPLHAYGISKAAVEHLGRSYRETHGTECINIRTSWVYGPGFLRDRLPMNMIRAAAECRPLHVPFGAAERIDYTYLDDAVDGVLGAYFCSKHEYDAYHISSDSAPSLAEIAEILSELAPGTEISVGPGRYRHGGNAAIPKKGALSCDRARTAFGYVPKFDIRAGLEATLAAERALQAH